VPNRRVVESRHHEHKRYKNDVKKVKRLVMMSPQRGDGAEHEESEESKSLEC
jgi:hypothetical protein